MSYRNRTLPGSRESGDEASPQFVSKEACQFSNEWEFEHRTSRPYYPQSNFIAESAVKAVKQLMTKALADV